MSIQRFVPVRPDADGVIPDVFVRNPFNYSVEVSSDESGLSCPEPSLTQQSFEDECNINSLMARFGQGAKMPDAPLPDSYGKFDDVFDFHSAMNAVREAKEGFYRLPAVTRDFFHNDPGRFVEFMNEPKNLPKMLDLGLAAIVPPRVKEVMDVRVIPPAEPDVDETKSHAKQKSS